MHRLVLSLICVAAAAKAAPNSDCVAGNADSSCIKTVKRITVSPPPGTSVLYDGPIAGVPSTGSAYWGFDFIAAQLGIPSPAPRDMFINRSQSAISLIFTFDLPSSNCGTGCRPGMEFKLNSNWNSFFPNVIVSGSQALTTVQIAPGQAYGFVISLWQATNPRLRVETLTGETFNLAIVGLSDFSISNPELGEYFQCQCGDGYIKQCYSGTHYSNGLMGQWYRDAYYPWDAIGCN